MFHLANKAFLFLLALVPLMWAWWRWLQRRGARHVAVSSTEIYPDAASAWKTRAIKTLPWVRLIALVLLILALARPQHLNHFEIKKRRGIDILVALDISGSMASVDFKPRNRLEVAKAVIADFVDRRRSDRIGLVAFAGTSYTRCPLTIDDAMLHKALEETRIGDLEDGTALGMALATSVNRVRHAPTATRIIILITDGVNNRGEIAPLDAAAIAREFKIKVYTIGVGRRGQAPYPVTDALGRQRFTMVDVEIDENLLKEIAATTGGLYFRATDKDSLEQIFTEIDRWEKSEVSSRKVVQARELYPWFLAAGLLSLFACGVLQRSLLRELP